MDEENNVAEEESISLFEEAMGETTQEETEVDEDDSTQVIKKGMSEVKGTLEAFKREQKVSEFLNDPNNADYKQYATKIKELALKPEAKGLTINAIANMVVPKDYWIKKGAEIAQQATQESASSLSGGNSARSEISESSEDSGLPDPNTLSKEDFEKQAWNIARGIQP